MDPRGRHSLRRNPLLLHCLLLLALSSVLLGASPNGCNGLHNVSVSSAHLQAAPASPDAKGSTYDNPIVVMRDNPGFWGSAFFNAQVSGSVGNSPAQHYFAFGKWEGLAGAVAVKEYKNEAQFNVAPETARQQNGPILPVAAFQGPGLTNWKSRFGDLVHGNVYQADLLAIAGGAVIKSQEPLYLKLSDQVALVPIVLVQYKRHPQTIGQLPVFNDYSDIAKAAIDFISYDEPVHFESELSDSDVLFPNQNTPITSPTIKQNPPDEIFAQCAGRASGIVQFQVVASVELTLDENHMVPCTVNQTSNWMPSIEFEKQIREISTPDQPDLGNRIIDDLMPTYVTFGDFNSYACDGPGGFWGSTIVSEDRIELSYGAPPISMAHELGHVLLGTPHAVDANGKRDGENLMAESGPNPDHHVLTDEQCESAFESAQRFSERYQEFNHDTYRTERPVGRPLPPIVRPGIPDLPGRPDLPNQCCMSRLTGDTVVSNFGCPARYLPVEDDACMVCAVNATNEAEIMWKNECQETDVLEDAQCDQICCSVWGSKKLVTRYQCDEMGPRAYEIQCNLHEPPD